MLIVLLLWPYLHLMAIHEQAASRCLGDLPHGQLGLTRPTILAGRMPLGEAERLDEEDHAQPVG